MPKNHPSNITWASIGCGSVCEVKSLPAMYKLPGSKVSGVFARNQEAAKDFAARHAIPRVYASVAEIFSDPNVDIVYIATPPYSHLAYAKAALMARKHVYIEKPMALDFPSCLEVHELAKRQNKMAFVAHYRRALPYFQYIRKLLAQNQIGKIISVQMELFQPPSASDQSEKLPWRLQAATAGGGYFYDLAPHGLDIIQFLLDDVFQEVHGFAANRAGYYSVEDTVVASFHTRTGILGTANWSFITSEAARKDRLVISGTEGKITASVFSFEPIEVERKGEIERVSMTNPMHIQEPFIQTILDALRGEGPCLCTSKDALPTAWAMDAIMGKRDTRLDIYAAET